MSDLESGGLLNGSCGNMVCFTAGQYSAKQWRLDQLYAKGITCQKVAKGKFDFIKNPSAIKRYRIGKLLAYVDISVCRKIQNFLIQF